MKSLFARLSFALLCIVLLIGGSFLYIVDWSTRLYYEEITQRLNASIAMYINGEGQLIRDGVPDRALLAELARQAMVINPSVEIYLLDSTGRILAHALPAGSVDARRVDLEPLRSLLAGDREMPLRGTNPRDADSPRVFSAYPVADGGRLQGYVYVVLGGRNFDIFANDARDSYIQRLTAASLVAVLLTTFLIGLLVFALLTRRLSRLTRDVREVTGRGFDPAIIAAHGEANAASDHDEIGRLRGAFTGMSKKIAEQLQSLQESDKLRRELVSNVSHDLRTPLSSMRGYLETLLIRDDCLTVDERRRYLRIAHDHTQRLGALVGELLELSKLESAAVTPVQEHFSLAELLQDVGQEFELQAERAGVTLKLAVGTEPSIVYADIGLIQRVLENLLRNALKHTPRGGCVEIALQRSEGRVGVRISDTGCGIAREDLGRVFDRYFQAPKAASEDSASVGLGLAIVKKILALHETDINVSSTPGKGTRFEFALPEEQAA